MADALKGKPEEIVEWGALCIYFWREVREDSMDEIWEEIDKKVVPAIVEAYKKARKKEKEKAYGKVIDMVKILMFPEEYRCKCSKETYGELKDYAATVLAELIKQFDEFACMEVFDMLKRAFESEKYIFAKMREGIAIIEMYKKIENDKRKKELKQKVHEYIIEKKSDLVQTFEEARREDPGIKEIADEYTAYLDSNF